MIPSGSIEVRKYNPETDKSFIYSSWLKSYKLLSYFAKRIRYSVYFKGHQAVIDYLLTKKDCVILIAHPKGDIDSICGYIAYESSKDKQVIHYIYVKETFRKMGVANALLKSSDVNPNKFYFTHWTLPMDAWFEEHASGSDCEILYDPYAL